MHVNVVNKYLESGAMNGWQELEAPGRMKMLCAECLNIHMLAKWKGVAKYLNYEHYCLGGPVKKGVGFRRQAPPFTKPKG